MFVTLYYKSAIAIIFLACLLAGIALTLSPITDDNAFLYYCSWLINEEGLSPYKDIHDSSFPGTFVIYSTVAKISNYSAFFLNIIDLVLLVFMAALIYAIVKPLSPRAAITATLLFSAFHLSSGNNYIFQRDFILILPILGALALSQSWERRPRLNPFFIGLLFGIVSSIKPQYCLTIIAIILNMVALAQACNISSLAKKIGRAFAFMLLGGLVLWAPLLLWLHLSDSLNAFILILLNYIPLYLASDSPEKASILYSISPKHLDYYINHTYAQFILSLFTLIWGVWATRFGKFISVIFILQITSLICISIGGKGWPYQWIPFYCFLSMSIGFLVCDSPPTFLARLIHKGLLVIIGCLLLTFSASLFNKSRFILEDGISPFSSAKTEASHLKNWLADRAKEGATIQPFSYGTLGPTFPALLELKHSPTNRFFLSDLFFLSSDIEYSKESKAEIMASIENSPPDFIVSNKRFSDNPNFESLNRFIEKYYSLEYDNRRYEFTPGVFSVVFVYVHR